VLFCEIRPCHARRHNDLEGHSNFSSTIYSFSILCLQHHYCGDQLYSGVHLLNSYIRQVPLFTSGGLGLGLKNLVLFTIFTSLIYCVGHSLMKPRRTATLSILILLKFLPLLIHSPSWLKALAVKFLNRPSGRSGSYTGLIGFNPRRLQGSKRGMSSHATTSLSMRNLLLLLLLCSR